MTNRWMLGALICVAACGIDAGEDVRATAGPVVRDSAGIEIVENQSPTWSEASAWTVGDDPLFVLRGSDGGDENRLLDPTSIDVDSRGRIIVGDGNQVGWDAVLVYDSTGRFQFQAGRDGEGPGEFGQLWWASSYRGDSIVAFDMSGDKLSIFSPQGDFVRMLRTPSLQVEPGPPGTYGYTAGADAAYGDGHFLAYPLGALDVSDGPGPAWYKHLLLRLSPDGMSWDTLGTFEISQQYWSGTSQTQFWYGPIAVSALGENLLYFGRGDSFEVGVYEATGRLRRLIRRSHEPRPVTDALRRQLGEWYMDRVGASPEMNEQMLELIRLNFESGSFA